MMNGFNHDWERAVTVLFGPIFLTTIAMVAFAANSLLNRSALGGGLIDAASFTSVRMISGAAVLGLIVLIRRNPAVKSPDIVFENGLRSVSLFCYMVFFSFAYVSLNAGTGALILFAVVQFTMFAVAIKNGERYTVLAWSGLIMAVGGLVYLLFPGVTAPDPVGALLMTISGLSWGVYSLLGKSSNDPLAITSRSFIYAVPLVVVVSLWFWPDRLINQNGIILAIISGAVTSGCGYAIWYKALKHLSQGQAATVQLTVPAIAALGGVVMLAEPLTWRLALATIITLGGVALVLVGRRHQ